jgi:hypothetical protein
LAVFVTDLGGASALVTNRIGLTANLSRLKTSITITPLPSKLNVASNQVLMISEAELLMANKAEVLINLEDYPIHQAGAKRDQLIETFRTQLAEDGCAVLKSFLTPDGVCLLPMHPMARQMPILPLMIHRLQSTTLIAVFSTAQTLLFRLIITKPMAPCGRFMIFRHLTLLSKHACISMTSIAMPTRLPM